MSITLQVGASFGLSGQILEDDETTPIAFPGRNFRVELLQDGKELEWVGPFLDSGSAGEFDFVFPADETRQLKKFWITQLRFSAPSLSDPTDVLPLGTCEVMAE